MSEVPPSSMPGDPVDIANAVRAALLHARDLGSSDVTLVIDPNTREAYAAHFEVSFYRERWRVEVMSLGPERRAPLRMHGRQ